MPVSVLASKQRTDAGNGEIRARASPLKVNVRHRVKHSEDGGGESVAV